VKARQSALNGHVSTKRSCALQEPRSIRIAAFRLCSRPRRRRWIWSRKRLTSARRTVPLCVGENRIFAASVRVRVCVCVRVCVWASLPGRSVCRCDVWVRNLRPLIMREADDAASRKRQVCPLNRLWGPPHSWAHPAHSRTRAPARYHAQGMCFTVCAGADVCAGSRHRRADTAVGGEWPAAFVTLFGTHRLRLSAAHQCVGARR
jgi:hypothetical protein